jgi:hypothetical protein
MVEAGHAADPQVLFDPAWFAPQTMAEEAGAPTGIRFQITQPIFSFQARYALTLLVRASQWLDLSWT